MLLGSSVSTLKPSFLPLLPQVHVYISVFLVQREQSCCTDSRSIAALIGSPILWTFNNSFVMTSVEPHVLKKIARYQSRGFVPRMCPWSLSPQRLLSYKGWKSMEVPCPSRRLRRCRRYGRFVVISLITNGSGDSTLGCLRHSQ